MTDFQPAFALRLAPQRLRFGTPAAVAVAEEIAALGLRRVVVLSTPQQEGTVREFATRLGEVVAGVFAGAEMHTPVEVTARALEYVRGVAADGVVSLGGGSTIGLGKAIALHTDLLQIAVPTTYAGSESTAILGQTENGRKTTITDPRVQPEVVVFDPALVATLPVGMTVTSGLNAMAHAVEALYAQGRNPLTSTLAREGFMALWDGLPKVVASPGDLGARSATQYGSFLCGMVLGQVGMSLHHKLCHTLGGSFGLPHAETHAVILPHAMAYNHGAAGLEVLALGDDPARAVHEFAARLGAPLALRDLGLAEADLDRAAELAMQAAYWNPRPLNRLALRALLGRAWAGDPPEFPPET